MHRRLRDDVAGVAVPGDAADVFSRAARSASTASGEAGSSQLWSQSRMLCRDPRALEQRADVIRR